jgi:transposase InsO family protein
LPEIEGDKPQKKRFAAYPIGYFHLDIAEVSTGRASCACSWPSTARASSPSSARRERGQDGAAQFLRDLIEAVPYRIHTVLTDNGIQFTPRKQHIWDFQHIFDRVCDKHGIEHRLTKVNHPWTNGQVERMNRTIKDATVKRYHYDSHDQLRAHLALFVDAYNHARRLKTLRGLTPYEFVCQTWTREPERFRLDPSHHPGPYLAFSTMWHAPAAAIPARCRGRPRRLGSERCA